MCGMRSAFSVANSRGRFEDHAYASRAGASPRAPGGPERAHLFRTRRATRVSVRGRPTRRSGRSTRSCPKRPPAPAAYARLAARHARPLRRGGKLAREAGERLRELTGATGVEAYARPDRTTRGDHGRAAATYRAVLRLARGARPASVLALDVRADARPLAVPARTIRRGRAARRSSAARLGDEQDVLDADALAAGQALVHAYRGEHAQAEPLAREAVAIAERDRLAHLPGRRVLRPRRGARRRRPGGGGSGGVEQALDRYGRKKNLAMVAQVQPRLEALRARASP